MRVVVVGAGISGLTTALALEQRGHDVAIIAAADGAAITSSVAGAVWLPYRAGPPDRVAAWAATTRAWLLAIARDAPTAGIDVLTGYELTPIADGDRRPWWAGAMPLSRAPAPIAGAPTAWTFVAPRAEPALFVPWLRGQLRAQIEFRAVADLRALADTPDVDAVVDCAGLGAATLVGDRELVPVLGQTVITEPGDVDLAVSITDDRDPDDMFYVIPRRRELVLGGCAIELPGATSAPAEDPAITARIVAHAARIGVRHGAIRTVRTGLRPYRPEVRLARDPHDPRIIHNYGHGGAGYTLSRGCALDVVALLEPEA